MVRNGKSLIDCMISAKGMEPVVRIVSGYVIGSRDQVRSGIWRRDLKMAGVMEMAFHMKMAKNLAIAWV